MDLRELSKTLAQQFSERAARESNPRNQLFAAAFNRISAACEGERKNCWCSSYAPFELIALFDLVALPVETLPGFLALSLPITETIDKGSEIMECRDTCTYIRGCTGGIESDLFPAPDVLIRSSHFCIGGDKLFHVAEDKWNVPYFLLDACRSYVPNAVEFYAGQLEEAFHRLEDLLGITVTDSKIREVFDWSNRVYADLAEIAELMKHVPTPVRGSHIAGLAWFLTFLWGSPDAAQISKLFVEEIRDNINSGTFPMEDERYRVFMLGVQPWYPNPMHRWLGREKKVAVVSGADFKRPFGITWEEPLDPRDPFISMAQKGVNNISLGQGPAFLAMGQQDVRQWVDDYHVDGIILTSHWGCHITQGSLPSVKDHLTRMNIPSVIISVDGCDPRNFDFGQIQPQIELFLNLLDQRKKRR